MANIDLNNSEFIQKVRREVFDMDISINEPLKGYTSFQIGGPCDYFFVPHSKESLSKLLKICNEYNIEVFVLGNGSNLLVTDKGFRGAVIQIYKNFSQIRVDGTTILHKRVYCSQL
jgi:UDP-N-acetylmuramate dehydrogenase